MPKNKKTFVCKCSLRENAHEVLVTDRQKHADKLKKMPAEQEKQESMSIAELADFVTALTITNEGPSPASQPSKLFTSHEEFQTGRNRHIPAGFTPAAVTVAEATRSIAAVYAASTSAPMPAAPTPVSAPPRPTPPPSTDWRRT
ncbi:hypothetical protein K438DRAFT_1776106 [Mycena galopus ATCC 62051]|nr:hypothetical protein K438DRAFT_1776106 [Mycena galopus ATCC 62051]